MSTISQDALAAFSAATRNDLYDTDLDRDGEPWGWMIEAVETQESIDDFVAASAAYQEASKPIFGEIAGFRFVAFREVQRRAGDARRPLSVVDFGTARIALEANVTEFV